ncbi:MAG: molybdopterin-binding protein [Phycisphaerae bacterium]|nr:molybdopterin-binding protein [Phycisphaerae bacterium]
MATTDGRIRAISVSSQKGEPKHNVPEAELRADFGIVGDAHAGSGLRQVSLLAMESIEELRVKGADISPGDFAENVTAEGLDLSALAVGDKLRIGDAAMLEVTQLGKRCHGRCRIYEKLGDCIMPRQGVFARVVTGGRIRVGDAINANSSGGIAKASGLDDGSSDSTPSHRQAALDDATRENVKSTRVAILTVSDSCAQGTREDASGPAIREILRAGGYEIGEERVVPDDRDAIARELIRFSDEGGCDLVFTTGGTGLGPRDVTPEATLSVCDRLVPGLGELMRAEGLKKTRNAVLSRGIAGLRGRTLIVNLPGSPRAVRECLEVILDILPHAIEMMHGGGHG